MARSYLVWQGILCFYWSMVQEILGFYWSTAWQGESPWSPPCGCCVASSRTGRHAVLKRWEVRWSKLGNSCVRWRNLLEKSVWFYFVSNYNHMCNVIQQYLAVLWSYEMLFSNGWVFSYNVRIVDLNQRLRNSFQAYFLALKLKEDWMFWSHFVLWFIGVRIFDGTEKWRLLV